MLLQHYNPPPAQTKTCVLKHTTWLLFKRNNDNNNDDDNNNLLPNSSNCSCKSNDSVYKHGIVLAERRHSVFAQGQASSHVQEQDTVTAQKPPAPKATKDSVLSPIPPYGWIFH